VTSVFAARDWLVDARVDIAVLSSITLLAAAIRLWHLGSVPLGLHGDEALTGLDARRVLHEGWIGPYVISALGQPTGPLYFTAVLFKFMPQTTFTIRFSMALFGIATIPVAYGAFTIMFNRTVAAFAALLLCVMTWHLHLSRTGFMVSAWPFIEVAVLFALFVGLRRRSLALMAVAGLLAGLGIYSYNAYLLFLPVPVVPFLWLVVAPRAHLDRRWLAAGFVLFGGAALFVAVPMIDYVFNHGDTYHFHQRQVSVTHSEAWKGAGAGGKADLLWDRAQEWERGIVQGGRPDLGDGLAAPGHPVLDVVTLVLALVGLAMTVIEVRRAEYATVLAACAILPFGAILTIEDGLFRRTMGLTPFVAVLAALPLAWSWEQALRLSDRRRYVLAASIAALLTFTVVHNVYDYFGPVQRSGTIAFVYPFEEDDASHYIAGLPEGTLVYFYSDRWSVHYETRRFIAPEASGIDRSREFRNFPFVDDGSPLNFDADRSQDVAFVFLGDYLGDFNEVSARYPGGVAAEQKHGSETTYRGYFLPARVIR
jgi:4-amino-4-deoxy-L-arabinose transferase-like glycosyltransferase